MKFNESLTYNRQLREQIDNLRRERVMFDTIYKKMEKELNDKKKQMAQVIEVSNNAYESRDEAHSKIAELKLKAEQETQEWEKKMTELNQKIAQDKRNKDLLSLMQGKSKSREEEEKKKRQKVCDMQAAVLNDICVVCTGQPQETGESALRGPHDFLRTSIRED